MHRRLPYVLAVAVAILATAAVAVGSGLLVIPAASPSGLAPASFAPTSPPPPSPTLEPTPAPPSPTPRLRSSIERYGITDRLQRALEEGRAALAAPGIQASVLFADGRQWSGTAGVADLATGRRLTTDTPFAIASVSKTFLAAAILLLVDEGRVGLDDPAAPLLAGTLVGGEPVDPRITIRMLLDHTSGLRDYLVSPSLDRAVRGAPAAVWTPDQALAYAGRPVAPPGKGYHYANTNYVLLGRIVERLTGRSLAAELRARFFDPLRLRSVSYQGFEPPTAELPTAYRYTSARLDARPQDVTDGSDIRPFTAITTATGAAGSIAASAHDLARWARALYGGGILPRELLAEMVADADSVMALEPPYPYGLGVQVFEVDGRVTYGHSGRLVGARTILRWLPEDRIAIAITTNQSRFDTTPLLRALLAIVAPDHTGGGQRPA
ncbi:MAG TPA: serine hydrolase domain-containing protein [Candidatus Limnocylindrales bacterium]|nr:serine hydrolase domain-containing protein [Candidatus Limnocylindrales bacterium]